MQIPWREGYSVSIENVAARPAVRATRGGLRGLGLACSASGVGGVAIGVVTLIYPPGPGVAEDAWSYPFTFELGWVIGVALAVIHLLTAAGLVGVLRADPHRGRRVATIGLWVAVGGLVGLAGCELAGGAVGDKPTTSAVAGWVSTGFGVTSLLFAAGSMLAGVPIARARVWQGQGRWMVLASGLIMIFLVTPANISGELAIRMPALMLWSLTFLPLGVAVAASRPGTRARTGGAAQ